MFERIGGGAWHGDSISSRPSKPIFHEQSIPLDPPKLSFPDLKHPTEGPLRSAIAVLFGVFVVEEVYLPAEIKCNSYEALWARRAVRCDWQPSLETFLGQIGRSRLGYRRGFRTGESVTIAFKRIYNDSGNPNSINDSNGHGMRAAPLQIKFFEYFLRKYTVARFLEHAFTPFNPYEARLYGEFMWSFGVFANDERPRGCYYGEEIHAADFLDDSELLRTWSSAPVKYYNRIE